MKINITNNIPNVNITINQIDDDSLDILLFKNTGKKLGDIKLGEVVKIGKREYIVLNHVAEKTLVITKDIVKKMEFGKTWDYSKSYVRDYCNRDFYKELEEAIGKENIISQAALTKMKNGMN